MIWLVCEFLMHMCAYACVCVRERERARMRARAREYEWCLCVCVPLEQPFQCTTFPSLDPSYVTVSSTPPSESSMN